MIVIIIAAVVVLLVVIALYLAFNGIAPASVTANSFIAVNMISVSSGFGMHSAVEAGCPWRICCDIQQYPHRGKPCRPKNVKRRMQRWFRSTSCLGACRKQKKISHSFGRKESRHSSQLWRSTLLWASGRITHIRPCLKASELPASFGDCAQGMACHVMGIPAFTPPRKKA